MRPNIYPCDFATINIDSCNSHVLSVFDGLPVFFLLNYMEVHAYSHNLFKTFVVYRNDPKFSDR